MSPRNYTILVMVSFLFIGLGTGFNIGLDVHQDNTKTVLCGVGYGELDKTPTWEPLNQSEIVRLCS